MELCCLRTCLACTRLQVWFPALRTPDMVAHACDHSTRDLEVGGWEVWSHYPLCRDLEAGGQSRMRFCQKKKMKMKRKLSYKSNTNGAINNIKYYFILGTVLSVWYIYSWNPHYSQDIVTDVEMPRQTHSQWTDFQIQKMGTKPTPWTLEYTVEEWVFLCCS